MTRAPRWTEDRVIARIAEHVAQREPWEAGRIDARVSTFVLRRSEQGFVPESPRPEDVAWWQLLRDVLAPHHPGFVPEHHERDAHLTLPSGGRVAFGPAGQWSYQAPPCDDVVELILHLRLHWGGILERLRRAGRTCRSSGILPATVLRGATRPLDARRSARLRLLGEPPEGQSAGFSEQAELQVRLGVGSQRDPGELFAWAERAAPRLGLLWGNSPDAAGTTHHARASWLASRDPRLTGPVGYRAGRAPALDYARFAASAPCPNPLTRPERHPPSFARWAYEVLGEDPLEDAHIERHLETLLPAVTPDGGLRLRAFDAQEQHPGECALIAVAMLFGSEGPPELPPLAASTVLAAADPSKARLARELHALLHCTTERLSLHPRVRGLALDWQRFRQRYPDCGRRPADDLLSQRASSDHPSRARPSASTSADRTETGSADA